MKKIIAIILAILTALSLVACGTTVEEETETKATENQTKATEKTTEGNKNEENTNDENGAPTTDEEIFKYIMDAFTATQEYSGDMTATMNAKESSLQEYDGESKKYESINNSFASLDGANKQ
jgi:uncharacterized protein YxeA